MVGNKFGPKKALSVAVLSAGLVLVGCDGTDEDVAEAIESATSTSSTEGTFVAVSNPAGSITGHVQDTNGNAIEGATVYVGDQEATTNSGGMYYFEEVQVTQTKPREDETYAQAVVVSIVPPAGYLGATVTVWPQAQLFEGTSAAEDTTSEDVVATTVFIDGYVAQAGTAVLPALTASVSGVLRDDTTEEAISGSTIALDLTAVNAVNQQQAQDGVTTSYATSSVTATTGSNGSFSFTGVAADANFNVAVSGYTINSGGTVATTNEDVVTTANVTATLATSVDTVAPWVEHVTQVINQGATRGLLADDTTTTITVTFSESMSSAFLDSGGNSIVVRDVDANAYIAATGSLSGDTLTITLGSSVVAGNDYDVWLLKDDFRDTSSLANALGTGADVGFDYDESTATASTYLQLQLSAYEEANQNATSPSTSQLTADDLGVDDLEVIQLANTTFLDVDDEDTGIQQLNASDDDDTAGGADSAARLTALNAQIAATAGVAGSTTVSVNNVLLRYAATNASYYEFGITDSSGTDKYPGLAEIDLKEGGSLSAVGTNDGAGGVQDLGRIDDATLAANVTLLLEGVEPGDIFTITPYDDFGYAGTADTVTLADNVAATTILQTSYGIGDDDNGSVTSLQFGDGGEQSNVSNVTVGTPYYDLSPRLLGEADGTATGPSGAAYVDTFERLFAQNATNPLTTSNTTVNPGDQFIDESTNVYDANAFDAYLLLDATGEAAGAGEFFGKTLGVAFSEDVALVASPSVTFTPATAGGNVTVDSFVANTDVVLDDNGDTVNTDLINFNVDNVYTMALEEGQIGDHAVLDFSDDIQDNAGNISVAANNPVVVIRDMIPPLVESAVYRGRELVIDFDKAIETDLLVDDAITMELTDGANVTIDLSDANDWSFNATGDILTIDRAALSSTVNLGTNFALGQYDDYNASSLDNNVTGVQYAHGSLDFSRIPNVNGATWEDYNDLGAVNEGYWQEPTFAIVNIVEAFSEDVTQNNIAGLGSTTITDIEIALTHQIDLSNVGGDITDSACGLDSSEIQALITVAVTTNGGAVNAGGNTCTVTNNDDGSVVMSFDLSFTQIMVSTDELTFDFLGGAGNRTSLYDGTGLAGSNVVFP